MLCYVMLCYDNSAINVVMCQSYRRSVVRLSVFVSLLDTSVSPTKTDKPVELPFGLCTRVGPVASNQVLGGAR